MARASDALNGFVDSGCTIRGELEFANSFRIDGTLEGTVRSRSELVVGEAGVVTGEIEVARCLVGGQVRGKVRASEQVVLHATARVWAEIRTPALVMEEGAFLEGTVTMEEAGRRRTARRCGRCSTRDPNPRSAEDRVTQLHRS
jgi:cytoskeletal protein CcmA (bactofilin family)